MKTTKLRGLFLGLVSAFALTFVLSSCQDNDLEEIVETPINESSANLSNHPKCDDGDFIEVNGQSLYYITKGNPGNPLLLFIHGAPERAEVWEDYLEAFSDDYYAVAYNTRGYYPSSIPAEVEAYTTANLAADAHGLATALGYDEYILVGHDWGGSTAWTAAYTYPEAVKKLVVLNNPHPIVYSRAYHTVPRHKELLDAYIPLAREDVAPWTREATYARFAKHFREIAFTPETRWHTPLSLRKKYLQTWLYDEGASIDAIYNHYKALSWPLIFVPDCSYAPQLIVEKPVLAFYGENDPFVAPEAFEMTDCSPNIELVKYEDGGHFVNRQYKYQVIYKMKEFLSE